MVSKKEEYRLHQGREKLPSQNQTEYSRDYLVFYFTPMTDFKN